MILICHNCRKKTDEKEIIKQKNIFKKEVIICPSCKSVQLKPNFKDLMRYRDRSKTEDYQRLVEHRKAIIEHVLEH